MMAKVGDRAGDAGFERFCQDAHPRLVAALGHHLGDRFLAEEFAHEALVRAGDRWAQVSQLEAPIGWAFRVGVNLANSHFRRRRAERRALRRHGPPPATELEADIPERIAVREALGGLSSRQRQVILLRFYLGLPTDDIAQLLGSTSGAVRGLTHRALKELREVLDFSQEDVETTNAQ